MLFNLKPHPLSARTVAVGLFAGAVLSAAAQTKPTPKPADTPSPARSSEAAPKPPTPGADAATPDTATRVMGFRSARFGMDEAEVRGAIVKDLNVPASAVAKAQNLADRTDLINVRAPDVLPGGGTADVAYVFGFKSKKLIQVSVVWSKASDKTLEAPQLVANGEALKNYFLGENFPAGAVTTDLAVRDGIVLFRGLDGDGHAAAVMLRGAITNGADDKAAKNFSPTSLVVLYIADPKTPDVFKVPAGRF